MLQRFMQISCLPPHMAFFLFCFLVSLLHFFHSSFFVDHVLGKASVAEHSPHTSIVLAGQGLLGAKKKGHMIPVLGFGD